MSKMLRRVLLVTAAFAGLFLIDTPARADYWRNYWRWHDGYYAPYYRGYHRGYVYGAPYGIAPAYGYGVVPYPGYGVYGPTTYYGPYGAGGVVVWR